MLGKDRGAIGAVDLNENATTVLHGILRDRKQIGCETMSVTCPIDTVDLYDHDVIRGRTMPVCAKRDLLFGWRR